MFLQLPIHHKTDISGKIDAGNRQIVADEVLIFTTHHIVSS